MVDLSAHRCGAGKDVHLENTLIALNRAVELDVEYVEFDVQRLKDGTLVVFHDDHFVDEAGARVDLGDLDFESFAQRQSQYLLYTQVLESIATSGKSAHIDFKFASPPGCDDLASTYEVQAATIALAALPPSRLIFTTLEDRSVSILRDWLDSQGLGEVLCGLSLGRDLTGMTTWQRVRTRLSEFFPRRRYRATRANLFVCNHRIARLTGARFARRRSLPMLVWTVDTEPDLAYWLDGRAWLVTTNFPERAIELRAARGTAA